MTELEKIEYAKSFIDSLANGINPVDDTPVPENDVAANPRLRRCFAYVSVVLGQVVINGKKSEAKKKRPKKTYFSIAPDRLECFEYSEQPITFSDFCRRLESLVDLKSMRRISRHSLSEWLFSLNLLTTPPKISRYSASVPTPEGIELGLTEIYYTTQKGTFRKNALNLEAQKFVIDNMEAFLAFRKRSKLKA